MPKAEPAKRIARSPVRKVTVDKGLPEAQGRQQVIAKALREFGGNYRNATYNPKTGKGMAM
jgi:hypothetical protein